MALDPAANFVRTTTDAAINSTQTNVSVTDVSGFPTPSTDGNFNVVIWDVAAHPRPDQDPDVEILRVTAVDSGTNTLTITRAQETTTGVSHPSGSAVHLSPTAKMFADIPDNFVSNTGDTVNGDLDVTGTLSESSNQVLTTADEGSGNGLDADTVDGQEADVLAQKPSVGIIDKAETFVETDVSISLSDTIQTGGSIFLRPESSESATSAPDNEQLDVSREYERGIVFVSDISASSVTVRISQQTFSPPEVRLRDSNASIIATESGNFNAGDEVTLNANITAGEEYYATVYGSSYQLGELTNPSFPYDGGGVSITSGVTGSGNKASGVRQGIDQVTVTKSPATNGTATIEWAGENDVYEWDQSLFQQTSDSGTVDVYVEANDGTGWTQVAGPISRGDEISANASENVRYRVELSRPDTSSNPSLDAIYRRYLI